MAPDLLDEGGRGGRIVQPAAPPRRREVEQEHRFGRNRGLLAPVEDETQQRRPRAVVPDDEERGLRWCLGSASHRHYDRDVDVVVLDPPSWTLPYDHALSAALARRGHTVRLLASPFVHGPAPSPDGYVREDVYLTRSSRLLMGRKRTRAHAVLKGLEYPPSALLATRRIAALAPDVLHVQWLGFPRFDLFWLRRVADDRPTVITAHEVLPPRTANQVDAWLDVFATVDRVVYVASPAVTSVLDAPALNSRSLSRVVDTLPLFIPLDVPIAVD